jgi:tetratricopeptide (TPR) repeat protein
MLLLLFGACLSPAAQEGSTQQSGSVQGPPTREDPRRENPGWLIVERAERLLDEGEFGLAIQAYRRALQLSPGDPEAHFGLGRAYKAIGDYQVAEEHLQDALRAQADFTVADRVFLVRYERADIYRTRRDFARYERELVRIIADDPPPDEIIIPSDAHEALAEQGLDRFLVLYRLPESGSTRARGMLAELLVGLGRYDEAAENATIAVLQAFTTLIGAEIRRDPTYEFTTVAELLERTRRSRPTRDYLEQSTIFHDLYYLAGAYWGERDRTAIDVWQLLTRIDAEGTWGARATRRLADPQPEPLIVPTR